MARGERNGVSDREVWERELAVLAAEADGPVLTPGAEGYDDEVAVFNLAVTHHPAVVVGATSPEDVSLAVRCAGTLGLDIAVLNTGHGPSLPATDNTLMITTSRMTAVTVDPGAGTARVQAGVRFQQLVTEAAVHGLAPLVGSSSGVGVVGYLLGGGSSITMGRKYGWASDQVTRIEVVTADGEPRHVSPMAEGDLFSALLGGKSNFGVVTAMEFGLFPVTRLYAGTLFFSGSDAAVVAEAYRRFTSTAPDDMTSGLVFLDFPPLPDLPEFMRGKPVVAIQLSHVGREEDAKRLIAPLRQAATAVMDTVSTMPYTDFGSIAMDPTEPIAAVERFGILREMTPETVRAIVDAVGPGSGSRVNMVDIRQLGGAYSRSPAAPDAVGGRDAGFSVLALTVVPPGEDVSSYAGSGRDLLDALAPWLSARRHPGFLSPEDATVAGTKEAYDPAVYERLQAAKAIYDPENRFRVNHNIPPRQAS
ncbi:FAD-binding oxidoreductase [Streptomyces sp. NPDC058653]|uniref:FAD-binding oxidoreductase n=1 Tax=Streptomyces sp. NPDC058653 TaxID=3346576 RepID=UPI003648531A